MSKRAVSFCIFLMLVSLISFGSDTRVTSTSARSAKSAKATKLGEKASTRSAKLSDPAATTQGFLAAAQIPAGGGNYSPYPAVLGNFGTSGVQGDVATIVNSGNFGTPVYAISVVLGNGDGTFQAAVLTPLTITTFDPIFVGDVNADGIDDLVILQQAAPATVQVWTGNGDGTFTESSQGTIAVTTNAALWATVTPFKPDTALDIVVADAATPNGNIWVLKNNGTGTFAAAAAIPFTGPLNPANIPNTGTVAFGDFNNDGYLDFAGPAGAASTASLNQMVIYLNNGSGTGFTGPTALATPDSVYDSCFNVAGNLSGHTGAADIVSANCLDNNTVTVYANASGTGVFSPGVYSEGGIDTTAVAIGDINGDGYNDIVSSNQQGADITVLLGTGDGKGGVLPATVGYAIGGTMLTTAGVVLPPALVADFNKDGHNDVIVPDGVNNFVYLQGFGDGSFQSAVDYYSEPPTSAGNGYQTSLGIASGDFKGDGNTDFVVGNFPVFGQHAGYITVFLSDGKGALSPGVNYGSALTSFQFQFVAVGDFNGDGKLDIAATDAANGGVQIFTGNGDGTFTVGSTYPTDTGTYSTLGIIAGDFNGDGKTDLAVVNNSGSTNGDVGVLINNGTGGFNPVVNYPTGTTSATLATEITTADVNGDKILDLIVPQYGGATPGTTVLILLGKGDGTFPTSQSASVGNNPYAAAIGDINGDGKVDLAVTIDDQTSSHNQGIAVALGNGDGTFQAATLLQSTGQSQVFDLPGPGYVKLVDVNRDGNLDLLYTNRSLSTVGVMYGKGDGTFGSPVEYPAGSFAYDLAFADVNGDGVPDVVTSGSKKGFSGVTVLLDAAGTNVTLASSANPVAAGAAVTFSSTVAASVRGVTVAPTGTVNFYDGTTLLGSGTLSSGAASFGTTLTAGTHSITAQYSGDGNFVVNTSAALSQVVTAAPTYTLAANPTTQTVSPGSPGTYVITMTPTGGYDGTVTFTCPSTLPAEVTCSFNPTTLSGSTLKTTLTLGTQGPTATLIAPAGTNSNGTSNLWASLSGVGLVGLVLAGDWKKRSRRRKIIILGILALILILGLGCGGGNSSSGGGGSGGGGGGGGTGGTAAGNYTVKTTATGTAGTNGGSTAPQTVTVTLVVN
jgi:hypothetical protein